jgi:radical SAM protein with 4Fe4S-binding SPASM domain
MKQKSMQRIFNFPILHKISQLFGKNFTKFCTKCEANRFDAIMDYYFGARYDLCVDCRIRAEILIKLISRWFSYNNIDSDALTSICKNITLRKVIKNYFKGLAIFGIKVPFVTGAPLSVVWNYTKKCNLKCPHCFSDSTFNKKSEKELTTEEAKQVIDMLSENDIITVNFCGGEPLMREDLFDVMKYTHQHDIYPSISTNATLLSKEVCRNLYNVGVRSISISLDSNNSGNHDHIRGVPGTFDKVIDGILNAAEFGKFDEIIVNTTLTDYNHQEIPEIYEMVKDLGATRYYVSRILPTGRGKYYMNHDPSNEIKREVMSFMASKFIRHTQGENEIEVLGRGMPYYSRTCHEMSNGEIYPLCEILTGYEPKYQQYFNGEAANIIYRLAHFFSGCATGLFYCGLDCDGYVIPCAPAGHIKLGHILKNGIDKIWANSPVLNRIRQRDKMSGKCAECTGRVYCGGCRLTAFGLTGDWLGGDLSCPF